MDRKDQLFVINEVSLLYMSLFYFPRVQILTFLCTQLQLHVKHYQFYTTGRGGGGYVFLKLPLLFCHCVLPGYVFVCRSVKWEIVQNVFTSKPRKNRIFTCGECFTLVGCLLMGRWISIKLLLALLFTSFFSLCCFCRLSNIPRGPSAKFLVENCKSQTFAIMNYIH